MLRSSLPPTLSTRITSAPWSASSAPQNGPAMKRPKSSTRTPASTPSVVAELTACPPFARELSAPRHCTGLGADMGLRLGLARHRADAILEDAPRAAAIQSIATHHNHQETAM